MNAFMSRGSAEQSGWSLLARSGMSLPPTETVLAQQLAASLGYLKKRITMLPEPYGACALFFSVAAEGEDTCVFFVRRATLDAAWREGSTRVRQWAWARKLDAVELRIDWPSSITPFPSSPESAPRNADPASAWAVADESLARTPVAAPPHLLLCLQGFYVGPDAIPITLPRVPQSMLERNSRVAPAQQLPYIAALNILVQQQNEQGDWANTSLHDHIGITYTLLLIDRHVGNSGPRLAALALALQRAIGYLCKKIMSPPQAASGQPVEQSHGLLVLARYVSCRHFASAPARLRASIGRSVGKLKSAADAQQSVWAELAFHTPSQTHASEYEALSPIPLAMLRGLESLAQSYWQLLHTEHPGDEGGIGADRDWQVMAMVESALLNIVPSALQNRHPRHGELDVQPPVLSIMSNTVWPEHAIFLPPQLRKQAAFFSSAPPASHGLVDSARTTAYRLLTAFALLRLADG
ncbi:hypothetical protein GCM10027082_39840 [Comamonas humi]